MTRKTTRSQPLPEPPGRPFARSDAAFVAALRDAATAMVEAGFADPGWPTFVRIAASELERFYAAGIYLGAPPPPTPGPPAPPADAEVDARIERRLATLREDIGRMREARERDPSARSTTPF